MHIIDDTFDYLIQKELSVKNLRKQYYTLLKHYDPKLKIKNKSAENAKKLIINEYHFSNIKVLICLETINLLDYRVGVFYSKNHVVSDYYEIKVFNFKKDALTYMNDLQAKYKNTSINQILQTHINKLKNEENNLYIKIQLLS